MARPPQDEKVRFLAKVEKMETGCHEWRAGLHRDGYGKFQFRGRSMQAHRVAYQLFSGEIPEGRWVLHRCDNRLCVNPEHLFLGDVVANIADMDAKGRRGTKSNLTESQVKSIKSLYGDGVSQQKIADAFGVNQTTISRVVLGKTTIFKRN
jgi:predicted XRE-type DNA-binding protein